MLIVMFERVDVFSICQEKSLAYSMVKRRWRKGKRKKRKITRLCESRIIVSCLLVLTVRLFSYISYAFLYLIYVCGCKASIS